MANTIHDEFTKTVENTSWLDEESKAAAIDKAKTMIFQIGYPNELDDDKVLEEYYKGLELQTDSLLHNIFRIRRFNMKNLLVRLNSPLNKTYWEDFAERSANTNAYYLVNRNIIRMFCSFVIR